MRKEAQTLMPELGGQVAVDEVPTTVKATPAEELLMPTSSGSSTAASPGATTAGAMTSDASAQSGPAPDKIGAPMGFGDMGAGPAGLKP
jgi:hypothetical protein